MSKLTSTKSVTSKTTKTKKTPTPQVTEAPVVETPVVETPVVETPVAEAPVAEAPVEVSPEDSIKTRFEQMMKSTQEMMNTLKLQYQELKKLQKEHDNIVKDAMKKSKKRRSVKEDGSARKPSGFASPVVVSDELYGFLSQFGVTKGDPIARTDVTKYITSYIKEKDLQNPEYRREIIPDAALKKLFGEPLERKDASDSSSPLVYTYLRLQKYLSPHFPKKVVA